MIWAHQLSQHPAPRLTSFSFGAGIQSTALMILIKQSPEVFARAGLTLPSVAFWADTGAETKAVSDHVQRLMGWGLPIPLTIVRNHRNAEHLTEIQRPPWFLLNADGTKGQVLRSCTDKWKIRPLERAMRAEAGFKKGQQMPAGSIHIWLGISMDEIQRAKENPKPAFVNLFPLLEIGWDRNRCTQLVRDTLPWETGKSACVHCPYRRPSEWARMRRKAPEDWARAVELDQQARDHAGTLRGAPFAHVLRQPLPLAVSAWEQDQAARQIVGGVPLFEDYDPLDNECSGLCGL